ncbi:unnamed protein product, partial [Lepidochelys olivacea]
MGKCLQGVLPSVPVTSEDGRVCFSPVKWAVLVEWQRELCELVTSLEEKQDQPVLSQQDLGARSGGKLYWGCQEPGSGLP